VLLAEKLLGKGFDLHIYDRFVQVARLMGANRAYIDREIPHLERLMVASPSVALGQAKIAVVGHIAKEDRAEMFASLTGHVVIDLVGIPELQTLPGVTYQGLCW
jgi:GDP-mannose 6-dehydrogenase